MREAQVRLHHAGAHLLRLGVGLEHFQLLLSFGRVGHATAAVDLLRDDLNALAQRHVQVVQALEVVLLFAGGHNGFGNLD